MVPTLALSGMHLQSQALPSASSSSSPSYSPDHGYEYQQQQALPRSTLIQALDQIGKKSSPSYFAETARMQSEATAADAAAGAVIAASGKSVAALQGGSRSHAFSSVGQASVLARPGAMSLLEQSAAIARAASGPGKSLAGSAPLNADGGSGSAANVHFAPLHHDQRDVHPASAQGSLQLDSMPSVGSVNSTGQK